MPNFDIYQVIKAKREELKEFEETQKKFLNTTLNSISMIANLLNFIEKKEKIGENKSKVIDFILDTTKIKEVLKKNFQEFLKSLIEEYEEKINTFAKDHRTLLFKSNEDISGKALKEWIKVIEEIKESRFPLKKNTLEELIKTYNLIKEEYDKIRYIKNIEEKKIKSAILIERIFRKEIQNILMNFSNIILESFVTNSEEIYERLRNNNLEVISKEEILSYTHRTF